VTRQTQLLAGAAAAICLAGLGVATYLTTVHYAGQPIACGGVGDCEYVNSTKYADLIGVPVALLGALAYATMFVTIIAALVRKQEALLAGAWGIAAASFAFSMYLTYIELRVIDAICVYCVVSASLTTVLFVVLGALSWHWVLGGERQAPEDGPSEVKGPASSRRVDG
jgi:uncharacterized membrane protein